MDPVSIVPPANLKEKQLLLGDSDNDLSDQDLDQHGDIAMLRQKLAAISGRMPRRHNQCTHCQRLKMICRRKPGGSTCTRCYDAGKGCIYNDQKLQWGPSEHELLREIASKDKLIDLLLDQITRPTTRMPSSSGSTHPRAPSSASYNTISDRQPWDSSVGSSTRSNTTSEGCPRFDPGILASGGGPIGRPLGASRARLIADNKDNYRSPPVQGFSHYQDPAYMLSPRAPPLRPIVPGSAGSLSLEDLTVPAHKSTHSYLTPSEQQLDYLLEKLRSGTSHSQRARRKRARSEQPSDDTASSSVKPSRRRRTDTEDCQSKATPDKPDPLEEQDKPLDKAQALLAGLGTIPPLPAASWTATPEIPSQTVLDGSMTTPQTAAVLTNHGCVDLTPKLDLDSCSKFPVSNGGFGDVYSGRLEDGTRVAIKSARLHVIQCQEESLPRVAKELHTWSKCRHSNVLELLGFVEFREQIGMVSEWMDNGDVRAHLSRGSDIDRCQLCYGISDGLAYLHEIKIIHGDLKGANVLVSKDGTPKLTDFGNSMLQNCSVQYANSKLDMSISPRWTAPEILEGTTKCSYPADIFALGMTLLETITGNLPYHDVEHDLAVIMAIAIKKKLPERPNKHIPTDSEHGDMLWSLLTECWAYKPEDRPSAVGIRDKIKEITYEGLKDCSSGGIQ